MPRARPTALLALLALASLAPRRAAAKHCDAGAPRVSAAELRAAGLWQWEVDLPAAALAPRRDMLARMARVVAAVPAGGPLRLGAAPSPRSGLWDRTEYILRGAFPAMLAAEDVETKLKRGWTPGARGALVEDAYVMEMDVVRPSAAELAALRPLLASGAAFLRARLCPRGASGDLGLRFPLAGPLEARETAAAQLAVAPPAARPFLAGAEVSRVDRGGLGARAPPGAPDLFYYSAFFPVYVKADGAAAPPRAYLVLELEYASRGVAAAGGRPALASVELWWPNGGSDADAALLPALQGALRAVEPGWAGATRAAGEGEVPAPDAALAAQEAAADAAAADVAAAAPGPGGAVEAAAVEDAPAAVDAAGEAAPAGGDESAAVAEPAVSAAAAAAATSLAGAALAAALA
jgi:hypothetical protein